MSIKSVAAASLVAVSMAASAFAGNVDPAPVDDVVYEEPAPAGSAAGWVVPVLAVVLLGAAIASSSDGT